MEPVETMKKEDSRPRARRRARATSIRFAESFSIQLQTTRITVTIESWDSLEDMNLILALEEELGFTFTEDQMVELVDLKTIVETADDLSR